MTIQPSASDFAVVLRLLIAAAGNQHRVARTSLIEGKLDRGCPIGNHLRLVGALEAVEHIVRDGKWLSLPRLVVCNDRDMGAALHDATEQGTMRRIGVFLR